MKKIIISSVAVSVTILTLLILSLWYGLTYGGMPWEVSRAKKEYQQFVDEKFTSDVTIKEICFLPGYGDEIAAKCSIMKNKELTFLVYKRGDKIGSNYYEAYWEWQLAELLDLKGEDISVFASFVGSDDTLEYELMYENIPDYSSVSNDLKDRTSLIVSFKHDMKDKAADAKNIFKILNKIKVKNIIVGTIDFSFNNGSIHVSYDEMLSINNVEDVTGLLVNGWQEPFTLMPR